MAGFEDGEGGSCASSAKASGDALDTPGGCQPTLLGIPQELRDQIFDYAYGTSNTARDFVYLARVSSPRSEDTACTPDQFLSPKAPLLICRQLYNEMKPAQVAAHRTYWTTNTFIVDAWTTERFCFQRHPALWLLKSEPDEHSYSTPAELGDLVADANLKHVHRFAFRMDLRREQYVLLFTFDGVWSVEVCLYKEWERVGPSLLRLYPEGARSENLVRTLRELNASLVGGEVIRDPSKGRGFSAIQLFEFARLLQCRFVLA